ncbi:MAG TPA: OsmC family protein [Candidatus Limnocylindria bacterium]|jgi:putative redox protein
MSIRNRVIATLVDPLEGVAITATSGSGFPLAFDTASREEGGIGASPTETVLGALAACTAMDVASILRKKRQAFSSYRIEVTGERAEEHPRVFTAITVEHQLTGSMTAEAVRRSVELSATRYCPVSAMLSASVRIEHRYRIRRDGARDEEAGLVVVTGPHEDQRAEDATAG